MGKVGPSHLYSRHLSSLKNILTQCLGSILEGSTRKNDRRSGNFNTGSFGPRDHTDMTPRLRPQRGRGGRQKLKRPPVHLSSPPPDSYPTYTQSSPSLVFDAHWPPSDHSNTLIRTQKTSPEIGSPHLTELSAFHSQINQSRVSSTKIDPLTASDVC